MDLFDSDLNTYFKNIEKENSIKRKLLETFLNTKIEFNNYFNNNKNLISNSNHFEILKKYENDNFNYVNYYLNDLKLKNGYKEEEIIIRKNKNKSRLSKLQVNKILFPIFELDKNKWSKYKIDQICTKFNILKITVYKWNIKKLRELKLKFLLS